MQALSSLAATVLTVTSVSLHMGAMRSRWLTDLPSGEARRARTGSRTGDVLIMSDVVSVMINLSLFSFLNLFALSLSLSTLFHLSRHCSCAHIYVIYIIYSCIDIVFVYITKKKKESF